MINKNYYEWYSCQWTEHSLGEFFTERKQKAKGNEELLSVTIGSGIIKQSDSDKRNMSSDDKTNYKVVKKGDIAYNTMRMWQGAEGVSKWDGIVSPAYTVVIPKENVNADFFAILFKTNKALKLFTIYSQGLSSDNWNLKFSEFSKLKMKIPNFEIQNKIVNFIGKQDELIKNQEAKLNSIIRKRNGIVSGIFNRQIKCNGNYSEWKELKLADLLRERKEKSDGTEEVYSVSVSKGLVNQIEHLGRSFAAESTEKYKAVYPGDVIYTKSPTGEFKWGIVKQSTIEKKVIISPLYGVFTPLNNNLGYIIDAYFSSSIRAHNYLITQIRKGAKNTINVSNTEFLAKAILLPTDPEEQKNIAAFIKKLDDEVLNQRKKLESLIRCKKALIQDLFIN